MDRNELIDLKTRVINDKLLYEEKIKIFSKEVEQKIKAQNLSYDNDSDIDKIINIDMEAEEKYKTDILYKNWTTNADLFIINGLKYTLTVKPDTIKEKQVETVKELLDIFEKDKSKLIIYRKQALNILFGFKDFCN